MSSTELVHPLIAVFVENNSLINLHLRFAIFWNFSFHCVFLLRSKPKAHFTSSIVFVYCIYHFYVIYFPGILGIYFLCNWTIVFRMLAMSFLSIVVCSSAMCKFWFDLHWIFWLHHYFLMHIDVLRCFVLVIGWCSYRIWNCIYFCLYIAVSFLLL